MNKVIEKTDSNKRTKKVFKIIGSVFLWLFVLFAVYVSITALVAKSNDGVANLFGYTPLSVQSESMTGTIDKGDLIIIKLINFDDGKPSETLTPNESIVTFRYDIDNDGSDELVTHLFIGKEDSTYVFQGTYSPNGQELAKQYVPESRIVGVYSGNRIVALGYVISWITSPIGYFVIFLVPAAIFFLYALYKLIMAVINASSTTKIEHDANYYLEEKEKMRQEILAELEKEKKKEEK
jgi:signal peptidase